MEPQQSASQMASLAPKKSHSTLVIIVLVVLLLASLAFGFWAFTTGQDYKNKSNAKVAVAVSAAQKTQAAADQVKYEQQAKQPYNTYQGPDTYGSIAFSYPKTWNAYIDTNASSDSDLINSYYYPGYVPGTDGNTAYALRLELSSNDYNSTVSAATSSATGATVAAYMPAKLKGVKNALPGTMITGEIGQDSNNNPIKGQMLIIPVRDKTLQIYTQSQDFVADFNNIVLPSLTFTP